MIAQCHDNTVSAVSSKRFSGNDEIHSPMTNSLQQRRQRHVHFCVNQEDEVRQDVFCYEAMPSELVPELFWSQHEMFLMRQQHRRLVQKNTKIVPRLVHSTYYLHGYDLENKCKSQPSTMESLSSSTSSDTENTEISDNHQQYTEKLERAIHNLSKSGALRGLESLFTTVMNDHRHWAVKKVLSVQNEQKQLMRENPTTSDDRPLDQLLRICCEKVSACSKSYAYYMAQGDAQVASNQSNDDGDGDGLAQNEAVRVKANRVSSRRAQRRRRVARVALAA